MALDATKNKRTDPQGDVDKSSETQAHLSNFDIDGPEVGVDGTRLKPRHIAFLETLVAMIKSEPGQMFTVAIGGTTDTLNQSGHFNNVDLSERRARAVETFLRSRLPGGARVKFDLTAFGAVRELMPNTPDDFSRAVDVALLASGDPKPQRPRGPSSGGPAGPRSFPRAQGRGGFVFGCVRAFEVPRSQRFKIRITDLDIDSVLGASIASIDFQIVDEENDLGAKYSLLGADTIPGVVDAVVIRANTNFTSFQTIRPTRVTDFLSIVLRTGLRTSNDLTKPLPRPSVSLIFKDADGLEQLAVTDIDMNDQQGSGKREIRGRLTMESTCRDVRGAIEVSRSNDFL